MPRPMTLSRFGALLAAAGRREYLLGHLNGRATGHFYYTDLSALVDIGACMKERENYYHHGYKGCGPVV